MDSRIVEIAAWSRPVDGFPSDFGERRAGREPLDQVGIGDVGSSSATFPRSFFIVKCRSSLVARFVRFHSVPIQSFRRFTSITTKSGSLAACPQQRPSGGSQLLWFYACNFDLVSVVVFQRKNKRSARKPTKAPSAGLRTANQNETSQPELVTVVDFI